MSDRTLIRLVWLFVAVVAVAMFFANPAPAEQAGLPKPATTAPGSKVAEPANAAPAGMACASAEVGERFIGSGLLVARSRVVVRSVVWVAATPVRLVARVRMRFCR